MPTMLANTVRHLRTAAKKTTTPLLSVSRSASAYNGEGKTTVRVINQETDLGLMVDSYGTFGFRLNNGITVLGPMAVFPRTVFSWQVSSSRDVTPESLRFFKLLEPKVDLVIIGLETTDRELSGQVLKSARSVGINVEILSTEHACSTFNFLNAEGRSVAAALIPPLLLNMTDDDYLQSKMRYENLYTKDML